MDHLIAAAVVTALASALVAISQPKPAAPGAAALAQGQATMVVAFVADQPDAGRDDDLARELRALALADAQASCASGAVVVLGSQHASAAVEGGVEHNATLTYACSTPSLAAR